MRARTKALLAAGLTAVAVCAPAQAAEMTVGPDLDEAATVAYSDPNDIVFWSAEDGPAGIEVPQQGEVRAIKLKGGTVQNAEQTRNAEAFDPKYDIMHWLVLRKQDDGSWRSVATSEDIEAPVIGRNGVTADTVTTIRQPKDDYRVCAQKGDRVALATVGGYVPTADGAGRPIAGFQNGLPYQVFAPVRSSSIFEFRAGGEITQGQTAITQTKVNGAKLLMQAVIGTGDDARFTCRTAQEQQAASGGGGGGGGGPKVKVARATPSAKPRKISKAGVVGLPLTCRPDGQACAGTLELRAHKTRIGLATYSLTPGQTAVVPVKLTKKGRGFVKSAKRGRYGKLRTAATADDKVGGTGRAIFFIKPR